MKHLLITFLFAVSSFACAESNDSCCQLSAIAISESPGTIAATITNVGTVTVRVVSEGPERDFDLHVTDDAGHEVARTDQGLRAQSPLWGGSRKAEDLKTGESLTQTLDLARLFQLNKGTYSVSLSRGVSVGGRNVTLTATMNLRLQ